MEAAADENWFEFDFGLSAGPSAAAAAVDCFVVSAEWLPPFDGWLAVEDDVAEEDCGCCDDGAQRTTTAPMARLLTMVSMIAFRMLMLLLRAAIDFILNDGGLT